MIHPSVPSATYRFQFHKHFTFQDAAKLAEYLHELGISHVYASPFFKAAPGSTHGYDICDHNELNAEVGSKEDFEQFSAAIKRERLRLLVDFVPNHMGIAEARNNWWMDVLEHGQASTYASFFDIDWRPVMRALEGKVLLPILGDQYGRVLEKGELKLKFSEGIFTVCYYENILPVAPRSTRILLQRAATRLTDAAEAETRAELESIHTALEHLPASGVLEPEKLAERQREQVIIKRRLKTLTSTAPAAAVAIQEVVEEFNAPGDQAFADFDALLQAQNYRLSYWRVAGEEINYRRFFDINTLAAIQMERPEVFEGTHRLIFELIQAGAVHGLRIDHVDGLYYPRQYLEALQKRYAEIHKLPEGSRGLYLLVEKILAPEEHLRADWPVHGTTGYEFANQVLNVLIDQQAEKAFTALYNDFVPDNEPYGEQVYRSKLLVMRTAMASEINVLGHMLNRLSETNRWYRDFTLNALTAAVRVVIASFPVYRSYITPDGRYGDDDKRVINRALALARRRNPAMERSVFTFLREVLLPNPDNQHPVDEAARLEFVMKFQQCSGPIMAKGVEDTTFYKFNRLIALNEVGGEPGVFGASRETFHQQNAARREEVQHCLLATSTHDTKRSEDVRARLAVLSELPEEWNAKIQEWAGYNAELKAEVDGELAPSNNEEYLIYQTILGAWPLELLEEVDVPGYPYEEFVGRIQQYMLKALHEAKVNSSWIDPNQAWDEGVTNFVAQIMERSPENRFLASLRPFARKLAQHGFINALSQTLLKLTVPGVPDIYQGNEVWDLSLVDPDNRRPVDYAARQEKLRSLEKVASGELLAGWTDGRIKLFITRETLHLRKKEADVFMEGGYEPVAVEGSLAECVIAFGREYEGRKVLVVVPRFATRVGHPPVGEAWGETALVLGGTWKNVFTGATVQGETLPLAEILRELPVAVLTAR